LTADIWSVYKTRGDALSAYWGRVEEVFRQFQFTVHDLDAEEILA